MHCEDGAERIEHYTKDFQQDLLSFSKKNCARVLTMLGIVIGIAAVLAMLAIGDGAKRIVDARV